MNEQPKLKINAAIDLAVLASVIMGVWSLRFRGIENIGALTMGLALLVVFVLMKMRGHQAARIGLGSPPPFRKVLSDALRLLPWFGGAWLAGGLIGVALFGQPQTSSAVTQLPQGTLAFLFDITVITWLLIALGEETVFRGFVLERLLCMCGSQRVGMWLAISIQAVWFGSLHASQGAAGMIITGTIGLVFAWYYLTRLRGNLWPLILLHGAADTIVLTVSWLAP